MRDSYMHMIEAASNDGLITIWSGRQIVPCAHPAAAARRYPQTVGRRQSAAASNHCIDYVRISYVYNSDIVYRRFYCISE